MSVFLITLQGRIFYYHLFDFYFLQLISFILFISLRFVLHLQRDIIMQQWCTMMAVCKCMVDTVRGVKIIVVICGSSIYIYRLELLFIIITVNIIIIIVVIIIIVIAIIIIIVIIIITAIIISFLRYISTGRYCFFRFLHTEYSSSLL